MIVDDKGIKNCWKEYMEKLMNEENEAPGLSGLVTEIIQATGDTGTQWILDLCNGIVKEGSIPDDWKI